MSSSKRARLKNASADQHYKFGQKSAALIGALFTSSGEVKVFAYHRPAITTPPTSMQNLYMSSSLQLDPTLQGRVNFKLTLTEKVKKPDGTQQLLEGLLTIEPRGWPSPYELHRTHFLGTFNPFGPDEIPYADLGGGNRKKSIPVNRVFSGEFNYDPLAADKATLTIKDGATQSTDANGNTVIEFGKQSVEWVSISAFDDSVKNIPGGVLVAIRVNGDNYHDGCATFEFTDGNTVTVDVNGTPTPLSSFKLNKSADPTVLPLKIKRRKPAAKKAAKKVTKKKK